MIHRHDTGLLDYAMRFDVTPLHGGATHNGVAQLASRAIYNGETQTRGMLVAYATWLTQNSTVVLACLLSFALTHVT